MLRNSLSLNGAIQIALQSTCRVFQDRYICLNNIQFAKDVSGARQAKIMEKLFGKRVAGSKKHHWHPETSTSGAGGGTLMIFGGSSFAKSKGNGKNTTRRMAVLNKLFMEHITDLLATGEASAAILGRGLQVTRIKISPDFTALNVYWLGKGDILLDEQLDQELKRCSGVLRHELSQLRLMGEVPRIQFVRDKANLNPGQVEELLSKMDLETEVHDEETDYVSAFTKDEFCGKQRTPLDIFETNAEEFPKMRHDVFGLNHRDIMSKILVKMRKSLDAWESYNQGTIQSEHCPTQMEDISKKLAEAADNEEQFDKFLAQRHKGQYGSKKYRNLTEWGVEDTDTADDQPVLSAARMRLLHEKDYMYEDHEEDTKSHSS